MSLPQPLPGRECGECRACCVALGIDDPDLKKADDVACPNMSAACGCLIYAARPLACRSWFCGWRLMRLGDAMRPDRSNLLLVPEMGDGPGYQKGGLKIVPLDGDLSGVTAPELVDLAGKCVAADVPIYLSYGSGEACRRMLVNDLLKPYARAGDRAGFVAALTGTLTRMVEEVEGLTPSPR